MTCILKHEQYDIGVHLQCCTRCVHEEAYLKNILSVTD